MTTLSPSAAHTSSKTKKLFGFIPAPKQPSWTVILLAAATIYALISWLILSNADTSNLRFRIDITPLITSSLALKIHVTSALATFAIGLLLLSGLPKGTKIHKRLGWTWSVFMASTAISSFFLVGLNGGHFSWIHGLSAWTIIVLPFALVAARRHNVKSHAKQMRGMFLGGMVIAGLFSFLPGRTMWYIFFAV